MSVFYKSLAQIPIPTWSRLLSFPVDPVPAFSFHVEIDGIIEASFLSCSGLSVRRETMPVTEGGLNDYVHMLPGKTTYSPITLKHGITYSTTLWDWYIEAFSDSVTDSWSRHTHAANPTSANTYPNISIIQYAPHTPMVVRRYELERAFPVAWTGPNLDTGSQEVAVETIEVAFTRFTVQQQMAL